MQENRTSLEIIAPTVEEAIEKGLSDLGLPASAVQVDVLDAGNKGLFGLGFRQARVRLTISDSSHPEENEEDVQPIPAEQQNLQPEQSHEGPQIVRPEAKMEKPSEDEQALRVARETVQELLDKMKVKVHLNVRYGEPDDPKDRPPLLVDVRGDDLSILIGPKAETLNALQYISALIIGKEVGHSVPLVVDVEGYRARRTQQIRQIARRMAEQAVRTGRRQVLEPMPANERRLIHIELREHPDVTTESVGEEPRRKVTINPK